MVSSSTFAFEMNCGKTIGGRIRKHVVVFEVLIRGGSLVNLIIL